MANVIGEFVAKIGADMKGFETGIASADTKMGKFASNVNKHSKAIGVGMTAMGGMIVGALGMAVKSAIGFNKEMANIATLIPGSTARVNELKTAIRGMAVTVGKDTGDLAQGAYQVISAFGDTADTIPVLEDAAKAATAGVATTTEAINLLSAVTKGYGDTSKEAVKKASDLAFQTVTLGQTTFPELAASIGRVIPLTAELGVSEEELFAVMATATGVTGKAAEVSTQLRGVMQSLMSPTADMAKLLEDMEFESGKAMIAEMGLAGSLETIKGAAEASNIPLQKYISSIEGQTLALALTGTQADTYIEKLAAMRDSVGLTDIAFKEQTEGVNEAGFAFEQAKIQIAVLAQEIGDRLLPSLVPLIGKITEVVEKVSAWSKEHPVLASTLTKVTMAVGALLVVLGSLLFFLPQIAAGIRIVSVAVRGLMVAIGPVGWILLGITTAVAVLALAWKSNWGDIRGKTATALDAMAKAIRWFVDRAFMAFGIWFKGITAGFRKLAEPLAWLGKKLGIDWLQDVDQAFSGADDIIEDFRQKTLGNFDKLSEKVEDWTDDFQKSTGDISGAIADLEADQARLAESIREELTPAFEETEDAAGKLGETIATKLGDAFSFVYDKMGNVLGMMSDIRKAWHLEEIPGMAGLYEAVSGAAPTPAVPSGGNTVGPSGNVIGPSGETGQLPPGSILPPGYTSFAEGGIVPGPIGAPVQAIVHGGETITPPGMGNTEIHIHTGALMGNEADARKFATMINKYLRGNQIAQFGSVRA